MKNTLKQSIAKSKIRIYTTSISTAGVGICDFDREDDFDFESDSAPSAFTVRVAKKVSGTGYTFFIGDINYCRTCPSATVAWQELKELFLAEELKVVTKKWLTWKYEDVYTDCVKKTEAAKKAIARNKKLRQERLVENEEAVFSWKEKHYRHKR